MVNLPTWLRPLFVTISWLCGCHTIKAASPQLDETFGIQGVRAVPPLRYPTGMAIGPDGKIILSGRTFPLSTHDALAAFTSNGMPDPNFGSAGVVFSDEGIGSAILKLAVQPDGKILTVNRVMELGEEDPDDPPNGVPFAYFSIQRHLPNGHLDPTFKAPTFTLPTYGIITGLLLQKDGRIIVGYYDADEGFFAPVVMMRFTASGAVDSTFGGNGRVSNILGQYCGISELALQEDGKIVAAGYATVGEDYRALLIRYTASGGLDPAFGNGGIVRSSASTDFSDIAIQKDEKIVASGHGPSGSYISRYMPNGELDIEFGTGGSVVTGNLYSRPLKIAIHPTGSIAGISSNGLQSYSSKGVSKGSTVGYGGDEYAEFLEILHDGRYLIGGARHKPDLSYESIIRRFTSPPQPMLFIPGIAGSMLTGGDELGKHGPTDILGFHQYLWPSIDALDIRDLNLHTGLMDVKAVAVLRDYDPGVTGLLKTDFYGPFLDHLTGPGQDYVEFDLDEHPEYMTSGFDAATESLPEKPDLFTFPYDWRKGNASHTQQLHDYIKNIRRLHDDAKIQVVAHSMGGILLRRYILDYGDEDFDKVSTIGTPFWGAPVAIYRLLEGDFYGWLLLDSWNNDAVKDTLPTFPAFHELLPSSMYFLHQSTPPVFSETNWDFDGDHKSYENYTEAEYGAIINLKASPYAPYTNSGNFHSHQDGRQDDWRADDDTLGYLHIYGDRPEMDTTVGVVVETGFQGGYPNRGGSPYAKFREIKGRGDKVVPRLSATREGTYSAPGAKYTRITSGNTEHTGMMANPLVWDAVLTYFRTGETPTEPPEVPVVARNNPPEKRVISIRGTSYVRVNDGEGNTNQKINGTLAKRIAGVEIRYGSDKPWVDISHSGERSLTITSEDPTQSIEIVITDFDASGGATHVTRYRTQTEAHAWQLELAASTAPELRVDQNDDALYPLAERIIPYLTSTGTDVDVTPPKVALQITSQGDNLLVNLSATDDRPPFPTIYYAIGNGPALLYSQPLSFPPSTLQELKAFAEDSMGNTSGLIQTTLNPRPTITNGTRDHILIEWPVSEGYLMQESNDLTHWNPLESPIGRTGMIESVSIPLTGLSKFFRLVSSDVEK